MKRRSPEHDLQKTVIQWLNYALVPPAFAWSVDHAGGGILAGALRKARGVRAGQPDIWVLGKDRVLVGIELKSAKGKPSDVQLAFAADCFKCGVWVYLCHDLEAVEMACNNRGIPLRTRPLGDPPEVRAARSGQ